MWLFHFVLTILCWACSQSTGTSNCNDSDRSNCQHSECSTNQQVGELLQLNQTTISVNPAAMVRSTGPIKSCSDLPRTDQALLQLSDEFPPFWVLCVHKHKGTSSRGWLVIQQRIFGTVDFYRNWMEYRDGFGSLNNDFWLGLESIHRLTKLHHYELLVEMTDYEGNYKFARYTRFEIGGENEVYALLHLGSYSGTAGDSLRIHAGMKFTTYDSDNDENFRNCGVEYNTGWWFYKCFVDGSNLNGEARKTDNVNSIVWYSYSKSITSLKYTRMMLRPVR